MRSFTQRRRFLVASLLAAISTLLQFAIEANDADRPDILIADFESENYGDWTTTGDAFGPGPARGTLPGQMPVGGFLGERLVNSFHGGDASTGTLTSTQFTIERSQINFLIGGGAHPGQTCMNLIVDGQVVRTATGPNDRPGGSEQLDWQSWDVTPWIGQKASLQIVDQHTGGWGHINVDQIVQSDRKQGRETVRKDLHVRARYLHLPVRTGAPKRRMTIKHDGKTVHEFDIELALDKPDFWSFLDVGPFRGQSLQVETVLPAGQTLREALRFDDEVPNAWEIAHKFKRPQFHFTSRRGWLNDPNGLVWLDGEFHLFYQHNPYGWNWGNMHWGHAVSPDLLHWNELPIALYPRAYDDWCFSGSAVIDHKNTSGFQTGALPVMVAAFTSTGRGECIVYSNDRGRSWTEFEGNPVVRHKGRDPRLLWHEGSNRWIMAVYDEEDGQAIAFHSSPDLKSWTYESRIKGFYECPDLFALPVDGKPDESRWVLYAADGQYMIGAFDGHVFTPESNRKQPLWHGDFYAAQTFSNPPEGRRIQIGWGRDITFPDMPFNQQMTIPCELTLRSTRNGVRLFAEPVRETASIRARTHRWQAIELEPGKKPLEPVTGELLDLEGEFEIGQAHSVTWNVRGVPVVYNVEKQTIECRKHSAPLAPNDGRVALRILVDRGSVEIFGNKGEVALSVGARPAVTDRSLRFSAEGGTARILWLNVHVLDVNDQ